MITARLTSSLTPVRPEHLEAPVLTAFSLCRNEAFSFQMAYRITDGSAAAIPFHVRIRTKLPICCYAVSCVPVIHADFPPLEPRQPIGLYPDILLPKAVNPEISVVHTYTDKHYEVGEKTQLWAYNDSWQALWFTVNEDAAALEPGTYDITLELFSRTGERAGETGLSLEVLPQALPPQRLLYTNWFHCDCLADWYHAEIFSDRFFEIARDFIRKAARNGMNMILLPAFTPPLDTPVGEERMTAQLVRVTAENGEYRFDFSLLKRFIDLCRAEGIEYFEHSHFFTQWGAAHAPKVMADTPEGQIRIFGWDTDALGNDYIAFLRAYLTRFRAFLQEEGLAGHVLFHISDEPGAASFRQYEAAYNKLADLLEGCMVGDALSDPAYADLVPIPIATTTHVHEFVGKCDTLWCYYTGALVREGLPNRLIQMPRERNRDLGYLMYYYRIRGFLHWGYNFYYGELCHGLVDPFLNPSGGYPNAGTSYCVYPAPDGTAYQSVRQKVFAEGLIDMRALELLESLSDRSVCEAIITKHFGVPDFFRAPASPEALIAFRAEVNDAIRRYGTKKA